jgi:protein involved in polysaccharide export with SLBB domain
MNVGDERDAHIPTINDLRLQTQAYAILPSVLLLLMLIPAGVLRAQDGSSAVVLTGEEARRRLHALGMDAETARRRAAQAGITLPADSVLPAGPSGFRFAPGSGPDSAALPGPPQAPSVPPPPGVHGLPYFGYDIFTRASAAAFDPAEAGPADPDYLIGTDDVLRVTVWGQAEFQHELAVDREGRVFIPTVGQIPVAGLTLREATEQLTRTMARSYAGLRGRPPTTWLDLALARLRPKRVFLMGEVLAPGAYSVGSHATVFTTLFHVGGPAVTGSLRDVRVLRNNTVVARVDLYNYLVTGEAAGDVRVQTNDVIVVPARGRTVSLRGEVRRPGIYELRDGEDLRSLLGFAGGVLPTAYDVTAQVDRVLPPGRRTGGVDDRRVLDLPLGRILAGEPAGADLEDGDDVRIFPVLEEKRNYVTIEGAVWRPGRYALGGPRTIRELVAAARGVHPSAYEDLAHLTRLSNDRMSRRLVAFDLRRALDPGTEEIPLEPLDEVMVYSRTMTEVSDPYVMIRGSVKSPGRYALRTGMTLSDLLAVAGGYTEDADLVEAEVARVRPSGLLGDTIALILHPPVPLRPSAVPGDRSEGFLLRHRDEVLIRPNPHYVTQQNVRIAGDVVHPGVYSIRRRGELLSELLERAGGPTRTSSMAGARFYRLGRRVNLDFREAFERRNELHDVVMLDGDSIYIPSKPHTVLVTGEVNNPGLLSYIEGEDVGEYIARAGGLTDSASYAVLVQPSGESRRVDFGLFSGDPEVHEGAAIDVKRVPPPAPDGAGADITRTVMDALAILTSAATLAFIVWQVSR